MFFRSKISIIWGYLKVEPGFEPQQEAAFQATGTPRAEGQGGQ